MRTLQILLVFIVVVSASPGVGAAAETVPGEAGIEDSLNQGIALRHTGNDESALAVFLDLEKRAPDSVRLLLHIATAAQATGKWIMAYEYLQKASNRRDDPYYQRHKAAIDNVERTIAQRVGQFRARGLPAGAELRLSGEVIGTLPMSAAKPIEVGSYWLEVSKPGYFPLRRPVTVTGGSLTQEAVELREQKPFVGSPAPGQTALQGEYLADAGMAPMTGLRARWVTWTLAGVGVAAAATSGIAFGIREQKAAHWNDNSSCLGDMNSPMTTRGDKCQAVRQDISLAQTIAVTAGIGAVVFGGAALAHWLATAHDHPAAMPPGAQSRVACTPGLGSVVCAGSF